MSHADLTASHPYAREHEVAGQRFHGGFLSDGSYAPPRTLNRVPAIQAWLEALEARGWPLVDCSRTERPDDVYPNLEQQRLLLNHGLGQSFWDELTIIAVNEGRGEAMCYVKPYDLQKIIDEDITATITGHLWKGLFWAHGADEAGDRATPEIGGHKHMWFAVRNLLLGKDAYPAPAVPRMHSRPKDAREASILPPEVEKLFESCMAVLHVECRAYPYFKLCLDLCSLPEAFDSRSPNISLAADVIARIQADEASHVAYLRGFVSELRNFTFRDAAGNRCQGSDFLDDIWERQTVWPNAEALAARKSQIKSVIETESKQKLGAKKATTLLDSFDSLASDHADAI
jgi:hypothetical protein